MGRWGDLSPTHAITGEVSNGDSSFMLTHTLANGVCAILLPTQGAGPALLGVAVGGAQGQLSHPAVMNSVPALPPALGIQRRGAGVLERASLLCPRCHRTVE